MFSLLSNTMKKTTSNITSLLGGKKEKISKEQLEEILIESDMDYDLLEKLLDSLPSNISREQLESALLNLLVPKEAQNKAQDSQNKDSQNNSASNDTNAQNTLQVKLIIGVNGAGKTTTIAKLARFYKSQGKKVLLGAGDTFRAAAIEQIKSWGQKLEIPVIATQHGHDSSALAFDAITHACAKKYDILLLDTAGRLHTQTNLTNELLKIIRVSQKALDSQNTSTKIAKYLVLDGTQGSSSVNQAKYFTEHCEFQASPLQNGASQNGTSQNSAQDGIIVTKLDGTSKGGAIFSVVSELKLPVLFLGVGERAEDLVRFNPQEFVKTLLDSIFTTESKG
ncbi:signal recognition particle-docking protein FtsY [Helicobacter sp. MIT 00-7814]|uniref:signal recognition particle-docking protein FtsY n=1 Tax=unclassified Helicobacter TaxID=2593540 RepID=UPI000E1FA5CD|nr:MULTISPECIES: signal recognition particle-docking protein FtsY [unclassified Helicobacter]RDU56347.1 signal recognition particle-docking protein FtsY [Helicobacter sp. MIT 99-10781]RDU56430.1 signal recognition particle-docking protein FtsY [Helicobacter sp. MIT 00-7814]